MLRLVIVRVLSRVDYCDAIFAGLPAIQINRLPLVLNAGAHLVYGANRWEDVSPLLRELHWLRVPERIQYKHVFLCIGVSTVSVPNT